MNAYPLSRFAASPKGDDTFAARGPLLGVSDLGRAELVRWRADK